MKPQDLTLLVSAGRPVLLPDGRILVARSRPDLDADRTESRIVMVRPDGVERDFTNGPMDSSPALSPDGRTVVFSRAGEHGGPAQLYAMATDGGEARRLTDHPLGASAPVFSPDGTRIAYLAPVPEPGRYGTDEQVSADAEPPRHLTTLAYRSDGKGFVLDRPEQIFVTDLSVDAAGTEPRRDDVTPLTAEPRGASRPAFLPDGSALVYVRPTDADAITSDLVVLPVPAGDPPEVDEGPTPRVLAGGSGRFGEPVVLGNSVYLLGEVFDGVDFAGRTTGLFAVPVDGGPLRRLTDERTVHVDGQPPVPVDDRLLIAVLHRGAVQIRSIGIDAASAVLDDLPVVVGGQRVVRGFDVGPSAAGVRLVAVAGDPTSFAELVSVDLAGGAPAGERRLTDWGAPLRATGLGATVELTGTGADGYPVHGWLVLPEGPGPHPVLLNVHGGPHSAYTWSLFDEAQVYASAGYAVVMGNPRGSAGYGHRHGRAIVGALGTVDADDVLALLDTALGRQDLDGGRVGVMGGSYGGFMTSWLAARAPGRFVAGISERAVNAWDSFSGASDIGYFFAEAYVGADRDTQWRQSPLAYADQIDIPLLIIHSEHDWRCPVEQAQRLYTALKLRGADAELLLFPAEGHELSRSGRPQHRVQRFEAILQWWQRHLPVG